MNKKILHCFFLFTIAFTYVALLSSCARVYPNPKLERTVDLADVIRNKLNPPDRSDELLFILTLSGGGTRAAALAYGVMEALNKVVVSSVEQPLLNEVDIISSVSGGSFTAAYYGLHGQGLFEDFKERFLYHNVQSALIWQLFNPIYWGRFMTTGYGRSNMAAEYYDKILFENATFAEIYNRKNPLIMIQATDIVDGYNFTFTPYFFSLLCSDLLDIPVSFAVTASSSFPGGFNGMSLHNYGGTCDNQPSDWVKKAIEREDPMDASFWLAKRDLAYRNSEKKKFVHLFDGGVSDNLGLRSPFSSIVQMIKTNESEKVGLKNTKKVVLVIVNSQVSDNRNNSILGMLPDTPGLGRSISLAITTIMNSANFDTLHLIKEYLKSEEVDLESKDIYPIHISFDNLDDIEEKNSFQSIPTSLQLPNETVDRIISVGGRLLFENQEFARLAGDLGAVIAD